ncbi:MAG TPA: hypothetical protein VFP42_09685 [Acidimicrobiia bacterium]|nr:hypothetical protein [Acidimicrobiia bacterium]
MSDRETFSDLLVEAVSDHGKATADLLRRVGSGEKIDYLAETADCLANVVRTTSRFLLFWDNIATLLAQDPGAPLTFTGPMVCEEGETHTFELFLQSSQTPVITVGLRRRGEPQQTIGVERITASTSANGEVVLEVDCGGQARGVYEGSIQITDANGQQVTRPFNIYIDPGSQST